MVKFKKIILLISFLLVAIIASILIYNEFNKFPRVKDLSVFKKTEFLATLENPLADGKNAIYAASLLYAWEEIRKEVGPTITVDASFKDLKLINDSKSYINTLGSNEYKASIKVEGDSIIAEAEFSKSLAFEHELKSFDRALSFDNTSVAAFGMKENIEGVVEILYYEDDDDFILKLIPKDIEHEILLFKSFPTTLTNMADMITVMQSKIEFGSKDKLKAENIMHYQINSGDEVVIPKIIFNIEHDFDSLIKNKFNVKSREYSIYKVYQKTALKLNEKGAEVKSHSFFGAAKSQAPIEPIKLLELNKPFLLLLKRADNKNPYFALWVANAELMEKE